MTIYYISENKIYTITLTVNHDRISSQQKKEEEMDIIQGSESPFRPMLLGVSREHDQCGVESDR